MRGLRIFTAGAFASAIFIGSGVGPASADPGTHRVFDAVVHDGYPSPPSASDAGWYREDTKVGGTVGLSSDFGAPNAALGSGALKLTTTDDGDSKAQLISHDDVLGALLTTVGNIDYYTYQSAPVVSAGPVTPAVGEASYQLRIDVDGDLTTTGDQTNLVYEPYYNAGPAPQQAIEPNTWQQWDATGGRWWSSRNIGDPNIASVTSCVPGFFVAAGGGGAPFTRPSEVATNCPLARVVSIGVNVGTGNRNYTVAVDGVHIQIGPDDFRFNFEPGSK